MRPYRDEPNVAETSSTETFVAGKFLIDNFRWSGVPFYVRTGKRLTEKKAHALTSSLNKYLLMSSKMIRVKNAIKTDLPPNVFNYLYPTN